MRPRSSRITGNMRGSKPVKMSTREPAACSLATAGSKLAARSSTSVPRRMSFPPAARLTRSGASSTARGSCRSEEHTSELQSRLHLVCRLLLEKKKKIHVTHAHLAQLMHESHSDVDHSTEA